MFTWLFVIVLLVGFIRIISKLGRKHKEELPEEKEKEEVKEEKKESKMKEKEKVEWNEIGEEFKGALYNLGRSLNNAFGKKASKFESKLKEKKKAKAGKRK